MNNELCPVAAILAYVASRGDDSGFLFKFEDGRLLTNVRLSREELSSISALISSN